MVYALTRVRYIPNHQAPGAGAGGAGSGGSEMNGGSFLTFLAETDGEGKSTLFLNLNVNKSTLT